MTTTKINTVEEINEFLERLGPTCVHVAAFQMTHAHLHLLLTDEHFHKRADLYLVECMYIRGDTVGGPWRLRLEARERNGQVELRLRTSSDEFEAIGLRAMLELGSPERVPGTSL
jgi:hypothetical protein